MYIDNQVANMVAEHHENGRAIQPYTHALPSRGVRGGGQRPPAPLYGCQPERLRGGTHEGGSFNITSACISLPQARHSGVPGGSSPVAPPGSSGKGGLKKNKERNQYFFKKGFLRGGAYCCQGGDPKNFFPRFRAQILPPP